MEGRCRTSKDQVYYGQRWTQATLARNPLTHMPVTYPIALELYRLGFVGVHRYYNIYNGHLFEGPLALPSESIPAPSYEEALQWLESRFGIQTAEEGLLAALQGIL